MNIGFIGAGKVGFSLGKYLSCNKVKVEGYYSRTFRSAYEAAIFTNSKAYNNLEELVNNSDTIFITTSDDSICDIWQNIKNFNIKGKIICHTSGAESSKIFLDINNSGAFGYSIHPMFPFSDKFKTYMYLKDAYFSIEGSSEYLNYLCSFFEEMGNKVVKIDGSKKSLYHLANVAVSNFVLSLISLGCNYLEECGVDSKESISALMPLISSNIKNIGKKGFVNSLTGSVERADLGTIKKHIECIPSKDVHLYKILSMRLLELSKVKNTGRNYDHIKAFLEGIE
ncbi:putative short-subunit dehydrogenase-like oxidoreductase (DUF2520 family) [Clostridium pascui]|uniref:Rossmann-like and DUF2520 domain-containing protein n=1 Tax=Clostridium pascui TaxID=46609 RepID=UPI00195EF0A3|nr:Rossmann-like and DUF2520 domain-containing protein [Clostridium pascui]MBM7871713.1 putative short-subunit dehydrogenase-like oxidoreductase (DUF2520 family) [Clostridium pascui]